MKFAFSELEFLLGEDAQWPRVRTDWGIVESRCATDIRAAGLASLIARDLAVLKPGETLADSSVLALARRLLTAQRVVSIVAVGSGEASMATFVIGAAGQRTLVTAPAVGVLDIRSLAADKPIFDQLAGLVADTLDESDATIALGAADRLMEDSVLCARNGSGWQLGDQGQLTRDQFISELRARAPRLLRLESVDAPGR